MDDVESFAHLARGMHDVGATMDDFGETLYLTAVAAGVPIAIAATWVLSDMFDAQTARCRSRGGVDAAAY